MHPHSQIFHWQTRVLEFIPISPLKEGNLSDHNFANGSSETNVTLSVTYDREIYIHVKTAPNINLYVYLFQSTWLLSCWSLSLFATFDNWSRGV